MKLAVFDIDGTLTLGDGLGTHCFFRAFEQVFGPCEVKRALTAYRESTDGGIASEAIATLWGRLPEPAHVDAFKEAYLQLLGDTIAKTPNAYRAVRGAERALVRLAEDHGWTVAIATGNWQRAALLKLACAGVEVGEAGGAYSEDGHTRADVLRAAIEKAAARGGQQPSRIVYIGDQLWDKAAADAVGAAFVGIGADERRTHLQSTGARVLPDYERFDALLESLEACADLAMGGEATPSHVTVRE